MAERHARTQYVVDRHYQVRFAMQLVYAVFGVALAAFIAAVVALWLELRQTDPATESFLVDAIFGAVTVLSLELVIAIPVVYYLGLRTSHRVAGPSVRIKRALGVLGDGHFEERIRLRDGDALVDVADAINAMAEKLQTRFGDAPRSE